MELTLNDKEYKQSTLYSMLGIEMTKPNGYKPFDERAYRKYKIYEHLLNENVDISNHRVEPNPDQHGIDLLVLNNNGTVVGGLEAESHGKYWINTKFPFKTCHFLYRKKKYITEGNFYVMMNRKAQNALMLPFPELRRHRIKIMDNAIVNNEKFYDVPIKECIIGWKYINRELNKYFNNRKA